MEYVTSNKGGVKLLYEGFVYVRSKALKSGDVSFGLNVNCVVTLSSAMPNYVLW